MDVVWNIPQFLMEDFKNNCFDFGPRGEFLYCKLQIICVEKWGMLLTVPKTSPLTKQDVIMHRVKCFCDKCHLAVNKGTQSKNNTAVLFTSKWNKMTEEILYSVHARETEAGKGGQGELEASAACWEGVHWPEERGHPEWEGSHTGYSYTDTERRW